MTRVKSGIRGLDEVLEGGIPKGSTVLIGGGSGVGKTILTSQFLYNGITKYGENGVYVTLEERPADLITEMKHFGWDFEKLEKEGKLTIIDAATIKIPFETGKGFAIAPSFEIGKLMKFITEAVKKNDAKRLVLDSIPALEFGIDTVAEIRRTIYALSSLLLEMNCTSLMTTETYDPNKISRYGVEEFVFRGVILLDIVRSGENIVRTVTVRKMREASHSLEPCPFEITNKGIVVHRGQKVFI